MIIRLKVNGKYNYQCRSFLFLSQMQMKLKQFIYKVTMIGIETDDIINELINTFTKRYQERLETKMRGSSVTFDHIDLLEYHLHKISLNRGSSSIESPEWIKNKGVTINPKNTKDNNCFQYAIIAALNHKNIDHHPERISKLKPLINNCNWKDIVSFTF